MASKILKTFVDRKNLGDNTVNMPPLSTISPTGTQSKSMPIKDNAQSAQTPAGLPHTESCLSLESDLTIIPPGNSLASALAYTAWCVYMATLRQDEETVLHR